MINQPTRIAIQNNGRLKDDSVAFLQSLGIKFSTSTGRSLLIAADNAPIEVVLVRHRDIPRYVQSGMVQYGIVGENVLYEYDTNVMQLQRLEFGNCNLVIAVPASSDIKTIADLNGRRIATSYPNSLRKFLQQNNIQATIVKVDGSVEVTPQLNMADAICDLVQSGNTLKTHNLVPLHTILESTATLIMSPNYQPLANDLLYVAIQ